MLAGDGKQGINKCLCNHHTPCLQIIIRRCQINGGFGSREVTLQCASEARAL